VQESCLRDKAKSVSTEIDKHAGDLAGNVSFLIQMR